MNRFAVLAAVACLCSGVLPGTGRADMITFDSLNINPNGFAHGGRVHLPGG
jgi:hypothetical protein